MKRRVCILFSFLLFVFVVPAQGKEETSRFVFPSHLLPEVLQDKWFQYRSLYKQEISNVSEEAFKSLKQQAVDLGIENIDVLSAVLLTDARKEFKQGNIEIALNLTEKAKELSPNYPPAYFLHGRFLLRHKPWNVIEIINEYLNGAIQTIQHVWMLLYGVGAGLLWIVEAIGAATIVFIFIMTLRYAPRFHHCLYELGGGRFSRLSLSFLVVIFLVGPLWFGLGVLWIVIWWMIVFWIFMTSMERGIAMVFIILISSAGLWLPMWISVIDSKRSDNFIAISNASRRVVRIVPEMLFQVDSGDDQKNGRMALALGLQYRQSLRYDHARKQYERAMRLLPEDQRVLINLGNVYFLEDRIDEAIVRYQKALSINPNSVEAHYNLAQAYREKFLFDKGEQHYQKAVSLNASLTRYFTDRALVGLSYPVVDASFSLPEALLEAFTKTERGYKSADDIFSSLWNSPLQKAPLFIIGFGAIAILFHGCARKIQIPYPCLLCGRTICHYCQKQIFHLRICKPCQEANKKVKRLMELRQIQYRRDRLITFAKRISILLPGAGHFILLHSIKGFLFALAFFTIIISVIWYDVPSFIPYHGTVTASGLGIALRIIGLILVYLIIFWDLSRIQISPKGRVWH